MSKYSYDPYAYIPVVLSDDRQVPVSEVCSELNRQAAELEAFKAFTDDMLSISWQGADAGGDTIQELAEKHGLIKAVTRTERCDDEYCACAEISDFPLTCYRKTYTDQESES